jgi:mRNA interferase HigB
MWVVKRTALQAFWELHPDAEGPLSDWYETAREADWQNLKEVRGVYPHADITTVASGRPVTIFNIGGNKYRLITAIHYNTQKMFILRILTHAEYSKGRWKRAL